MAQRWTDYLDCPKCAGGGWLWWDELDEYDGPAIQTGRDNTRYTCDHHSHLIEVTNTKARTGRPARLNGLSTSEK